MKIDADINIEDLVKEFPSSVQWLRERGIICIICGEPVWGSLKELLSASGKNDIEIQQITSEIKEAFRN
jgi:hypothetical protein